MINRLICFLVRSLLGLRYRVEVTGMSEIAARGTQKILFLPSHPALIDPVIVLSELYPKFAPHTIADQDGGADEPSFRWLSRRFGVRIMPLMFKRGPEARSAIEKVMEDSITGLGNGETLLFYPAGHLLRSNREEIGANSAVETVLQRLPDVRVVLVRTRGLWGSSFSTAREGHDPRFDRELAGGIRIVLKNLIFFTPRRRVTIELHEPADLPRTADRNTLNRYLENYYNQEPLPRNTHVPYYFWQGSKPVELPEPARASHASELEQVPPSTRELVGKFLQELSGQAKVRDTDQLGNDLGLDSLARAEVLAWLSAEFGFPQGNVDALQTVGDVMLAASGEAVSGGPTQLRPVPDSWFAPGERRRLQLPPGETVTEVFLRQVDRRPQRVIVGDQSSGVRTYLGLVTAIFVLLPEMKKLPGSHVGIMLPASVTAVVVYLALLFAGKTPVMVNWTVGWRNLAHSLDLVGVQRVLTAEALVRRVEAQGTDLRGVADRFVYLEKLAGGITKRAKLAGWLRARFARGALARAQTSPVAAVLFTSGSESLPKAVPLTHGNLLTNLRDVTQAVELYETDRLLGMLPPFHSFGLTGNMVFAVCGGMTAVYHPNPTEGAALARIISAYEVTVTLGTPTFLHGILRAATREQLKSLRLAVTGAEECPPRVYAALAERCPQAVLLEGYGITECSPIVSINDERAPRPYTIGRTMPSLERAIVSVETGEPVPAGASGMLLLRGPSIFHGYLGDAPSPFTEHAGGDWYRTGDLVSEEPDGVLTFRGRLKRFVKIGGEMISLPAIEAVLASADASGEDDGPSLAVLATSDTDRPELVLFSTREMTREDANQRLKSAGLSPLHNVRRAVKVDAIPVLGTGKTDYRALQEKLSTLGSGVTAG